VVADKSGKFLVWNGAATEMIGVGAADIEPEQWSEYYRIYRPDTNELVASDQLPLVRAMRGEVVDEQDVVVHHDRTGRRVWLCCNGRPLFDEAGEITGGVVVFRDVTERRRVERELEEYAHMVSHDLKAPLTGILGFAEALENEYGDRLGAPGLECLGQIQSAAKRMHNLIDDLLRHASIKDEWRHAAAVDLNEVVAGAIENLEGDINKSGAEVHVQEGLPVIGGYAAGLEQVFQNLIGNAIKFVAPGVRPRIEIGCVEEASSCKLFVRDNGVGIDPKYRRDIFDVFRRLYGRDEYGGTGIGLAIVKKITGLHRGDVWVESEKGAGSTFWLRLPKQSGE